MSQIESQLKYWTQSPPSPVALRVADLLDEWQGLHHYEESLLRRMGESPEVALDEPAKSRRK